MRLTERQVDDDVGKSKFIIDVALGVREIRSGSAPPIRVDRVGATVSYV